MRVRIHMTYLTLIDNLVKSHDNRLFIKENGQQKHQKSKNTILDLLEKIRSKIGSPDDTPQDVNDHLYNAYCSLNTADARKKENNGTPNTKKNLENAIKALVSANNALDLHSSQLNNDTGEQTFYRSTNPMTTAQYTPPIVEQTPLQKLKSSIEDDILAPLKTCLEVTPNYHKEGPETWKEGEPFSSKIIVKDNENRATLEYKNEVINGIAEWYPLLKQKIHQSESFEDMKEILNEEMKNCESFFNDIITLSTYENPVVVEDGWTYELTALLGYAQFAGQNEQTPRWPRSQQEVVDARGTYNNDLENFLLIDFCDRFEKILAEVKEVISSGDLVSSPVGVTTSERPSDVVYSSSPTGSTASAGTFSPPPPPPAEPRPNETIGARRRFFCC